MSQITLNIFGSCCTREIINYSEHFKVNSYVQQNPIHTLSSKPLPINENEAVSALNSNFIKRMIKCEFDKKAIELLFSQESDYLIIDFADCRFGYCEITEPKELAGIKIAETWNTVLTLEGLRKSRNIEYVKKPPSTIKEEEWDRFIDDFISKIKTHYKEEQIIINEISFAEKYIENNEIKTYNANGIELSAKDLIIKIENKVKTKLPNAKVIKRSENVFGNPKHPFGNLPLHYANYVYKYMVKQLEYLLNIVPNNIG